MGRIFALCLVAALVAGCSSHGSLHGTAIAPPRPPARFTLHDQNGRPFVLAGASDRPALVYFGFTRCKDVCPQTLAILGQARRRSGMNTMRIVMVTVDPAHDSPGAMRQFFKRVGIRAIGLTGTRVQLRAVYRAYGVAVEPRKHDIAHSDYVDVLDDNGRLVEIFDAATPARDVAADLREVAQ